MLRAVLDTNVLVSALLSRSGIPAQILARSGEYQLLVSDVLLDEVRDVLSRKRIRRKYPLSDDDVVRFVSLVRLAGEFVTLDPLRVENVIPSDPPDNLILATAVQGRADVLVSGNVHLLQLDSHAGIRMVTPAAFLSALLSRLG